MTLILPVMPVLQMCISLSEEKLFWLSTCGEMSPKSLPSSGAYVLCSLLSFRYILAATRNLNIEYFFFLHA